MFGLVKGKNVGLLIDSSHLNCGPRRMDFLRGLLVINYLVYNGRH